jgi:hypothetical protein
MTMSDHERVMTGSWWHNPERASHDHYSIDGLASLCHREFNSEWQRNMEPTRRCTSCASHVLRLLELTL